MDSSKLFALGWRPRVPLVEGLQLTYRAYVANLGAALESVESANAG